MIAYVNRLLRFENLERKDWFVFFGFFFALNLPALYNHYHRPHENAYVFFAESLLRGDLTLTGMHYYGDLVSFNGQYYLPYPPLPSLVLLPFVFLFGADTNVVLISIFISFANFVLLYRILSRLRIEQPVLSWSLMAFFFGTSYWYAFFTTHSVYAFAHICSLLFQLLFLHELLGSRRAWLMGVYIGCSMLCRQFTVFYMVIPLAVIVFSWDLTWKGKFRQLTALVLPFAILAGGYLYYNFIRFGDPFDTGYGNIVYIGEAKERVEMHGVFSIKYVLFNLYTHLLKGFNIVFEGKGMLHLKDMDLWGTSLLSASPFIVFALRRNVQVPYRVWIWLSIVLIFSGILFYHNNGYHQVNAMRFTLDFLPLLMILLAAGVRMADMWIFRGMVIYSVMINAIAFIIHYLRD